MAVLSRLVALSVSLGSKQPVTIRFIPNIANHILRSGAEVNLKGVVIGNGVCHCSGEQ